MTVKELAKMIDHSLLHPTMTDEQLNQGCLLAREYDVASVCIKPYAVDFAKQLLSGSQIEVGTVIGFPHGNSALSIKLAETEKAIADGASEIDMVLNLGKVLGEDWGFIEKEVETILTACHNSGAILKVIFENDYLDLDDHKIKLCEICSQAGVDFVKTSTGYGFVKNAEGTHNYLGATDHDLKLMRQYSDPKVQVKAAGGVRTLDDLLHVRKLGVTRVGATATKTILDEAKKRFQVEA